jgi:hypothetical protein
MMCPQCIDDDVEMTTQEVECLKGWGATDLADSIMVTLHICPVCKFEQTEEDNDDSERWEE